MMISAARRVLGLALDLLDWLVGWRDPFHDVPGELMLGAGGAIAIMVLFGVGVFVLVST